ncbi:hypothetical protein [Microbispora sp. NPDC046933]|uniref:hypothetical protein n=1 Tax=Microbispora sp. NPDC046933 TaxID=3155618 RepID=UPI00340D9096
MLDLPGTFELLADAGYAEFEIGGDYDGRTAQQVRELAATYGLKVAGNHAEFHRSSTAATVGATVTQP